VKKNIGKFKYYLIDPIFLIKSFRVKTLLDRINIHIQNFLSKKTSNFWSIKIEPDSSDDSDDDYGVKKHNVLITELGENEYDSEGDELEDEDRLVITPKKKKNIVFYENDIYNEKDWDTDLEGK
jgi:hypothetical protein